MKLLLASVFSAMMLVGPVMAHDESLVCNTFAGVVECEDRHIHEVDTLIDGQTDEYEGEDVVIDTTIYVDTETDDAGIGFAITWWF